MDYFNGYETLERVKKHYRTLAKKFHPDITKDDGEAMKAINAQYLKKLKALDGSTDGDFTYRYDEAKETAVMEKLQEVLKVPVECDVFLVGRWLWVKIAKEHRAHVKDIGFRWSPNKELWYWHNDGYTRSRGDTEFSEIADRYGCKVYKANEKVKIGVAA